MRINSMTQKLRTVVAIGLRQEYAPLWPVPLPPPLPQNKEKPTLVLDIDETLLHTFGMQRGAEGTVAFSVFLRPHLREFLEEVKEMYEVVFWTAGTASYCSAMVDAIEAQVLQLPRSFYNVQEIQREIAQKGSSTQHVNFFALSRTQTLVEQHYMKYLPMLGRPMHRVVMVDDNVRSFPLHPRNGIKIAPFQPDGHVLSEYAQALQIVRKDASQKNAALLACIERGEAEISRLESDEALLQLLPVLRAAAKADDLPRELDHWRDDGYVQCDDFRETMNPRSVTRRKVLGSVLSSRRETPIPLLKTHVLNHGFVEEANTAVRLYHINSARARL